MDVLRSQLLANIRAYERRLNVSSAEHDELASVQHLGSQAPFFDLFGLRLSGMLQEVQSMKVAWLSIPWTFFSRTHQ
jgi:hypothetical protein